MGKGFSFSLEEQETIIRIGAADKQEGFFSVYTTYPGVVNLIRKRAGSMIKSVKPTVIEMEEKAWDIKMDIKALATTLGIKKVDGKDPSGYRG